MEKKKSFKKYFTLGFFAVAVIAILLAIFATPTKFWPTEREDGTYDLEIRMVNRLSKKVTVPAEYDGNKVTSFLVDAYDSDTTFEKVETIVLEEGIEEIDLNLLDCCPNLKRLELPSTIKNVVGTITNAVEVVIAENDNIELKSGCFIEKKTSTVIASQHYAEIPDGVKVIGDEAFSGAKLKTIKLPASVEKIGNRAFSGVELDEAIDLTISSNIKYVGNSAFWAPITINKFTVSTNTPLPETLFGESKNGGATLKSIVLDVKPNIVDNVNDEEPEASVFRVSGALNHAEVLRFLYIKDGVAVGSVRFGEVDTDLEGYKKYDLKITENEKGYTILTYVWSTSDN